MHKSYYDQSITPAALNYVAKITELIGRLDAMGKISATDKDIDRCRTDSVLATLAVDEITDNLSYRNAESVYGSIDEVISYNTKDLLRVHKLLTGNTQTGSGVFRLANSGIYMRDDLVYVGEKPENIPLLIEELFEWMRTTELHPIIKSSLVHFELGCIHPFDSKNGVVARLWQRIILAEWNGLFSWLALEVELNRRRKDYFEVFYASSRAAGPGRFIEYMLKVIYQSLNEISEIRVVRTFDQGSLASLSPAESVFLGGVVGFIEANSSITNRDAQRLTGRSAESVKKYLARLVELGLLEARGEKKGRRYILSSKKVAL